LSRMQLDHRIDVACGESLRAPARYGLTRPQTHANVGDVTPPLGRGGSLDERAKARICGEDGTAVAALEYAHGSLVQVHAKHALRRGQGRLEVVEPLPSSVSLASGAGAEKSRGWLVLPSGTTGLGAWLRYGQLRNPDPNAYPLQGSFSAMPPYVFSPKLQGRKPAPPLGPLNATSQSKITQISKNVP